MAAALSAISTSSNKRQYQKSINGKTGDNVGGVDNGKHSSKYDGENAAKASAKMVTAYESVIMAKISRRRRMGGVARNQ